MEIPKTIALALFECQKEYPEIGKANKAKNYDYVSLGDIFKAVKPVLHKHDLAILQFPWMTEDSFLKITTCIIHKEGNVLTINSVFDQIKEDEVTFHGKKSMNTIQRFGASVTYAKRYSLCAILGIEADEDTDGATPENKGKPPKYSQQPTQKQKPVTYGKLLKDVYKDCIAEVSKHPKNDQAAMFSYIEEYKNVKERLIYFLEKSEAKLNGGLDGK